MLEGRKRGNKLDLKSSCGCRRSKILRQSELRSQDKVWNRDFIII